MRLLKSYAEWQIAAQVGITALLLLGTLGLSVASRPAAPFAAVGLGVLVLLRLGDIASLTLKAFGAEAIITRAERAASDADRAAQDAVEAIEALKEVGMTLSSVVLSMQPLLGRNATISIDGALETRNEIVTKLKALGCSPDQIAGVLESFNEILIKTMVYGALEGMVITQALDLEKELAEPLGYAPIDMTLVREIFAKYKITDKAERWLSQAEQFRRTGEIDPDKLEHDRPH